MQEYAKSPSALRWRGAHLPRWCTASILLRSLNSELWKCAVLSDSSIRRLEISRSEALTGRKQFSWFDVGELAAELAEMYDPLAEEAGASLEFDRPPRPVPPR